MHKHEFQIHPCGVAELQQLCGQSSTWRLCTRGKPILHLWASLLTHDFWKRRVIFLGGRRAGQEVEVRTTNKTKAQRISAQLPAIEGTREMPTAVPDSFVQLWCLCDCEAETSHLNLHMVPFRTTHSAGLQQGFWFSVSGAIGKLACLLDPQEYAEAAQKTIIGEPWAVSRCMNLGLGSPCCCNNLGQLKMRDSWVRKSVSSKNQNTCVCILVDPNLSHDTHDHPRDTGGSSKMEGKIILTDIGILKFLPFVKDESNPILRAVMKFKGNKRAGLCGTLGEGPQEMGLSLFYYGDR